MPSTIVFSVLFLLLSHESQSLTYWKVSKRSWFSRICDSPSSLKQDESEQKGAGSFSTLLFPFSNFLGSSFLRTIFFSSFFCGGLQFYMSFGHLKSKHSNFLLFVIFSQFYLFCVSKGRKLSLSRVCDMEDQLLFQRFDSLPSGL